MDDRFQCVGSRALVACALLTGLAACSSSEVDVVPEAEEVVIGSRPSPAAFLRVPESGPGGVDIRISSPGAERHKRRKSDGSVIVHATVLLENRGEREAVFHVRASRLVDHDHHDLLLLGTPEVAPETSSDASVPEPGTVELLPGERRRFELAFRSDWTRDARQPFPCWLILHVSTDGREQTVRVRLRAFDPNAEPRWGWGWYGYGGPGYWGPGYYYGGWGPWP